ncbi:hypothetical protein CCAX7_19310 [Capsulimonas corticalis]|uniref:Uncharacterized protein n=1 Tax=Capsulimonas corticalis TaxID=2219043 RepID=A0A402D598_9BACT|nr:class I SAM-dependent rRNA methyltransferase [Capsulimonas corticalis]BDI29880.1 hypothetical protein CCAX7_19310 [Capsulimonas corticalis]
MAIPTIKLKPQRPERLTHPWIYDNEIGAGPGADFTNGGLVRVLDARGKTLGVGYLNSRSKIAVRYLTRKNVPVDDAFWRARVQAAFDYRAARYAADGGAPPAYRLIHGESDGIPGLVVDIYQDFAVAQFLALGLEPWRDVLVQSIAEITGVRGVYERSDSTVRKLEGLEEQTGVLWGEEPPEIVEFEHDGSILLADVKTGGKTGLFLDQIDNQRAAAREAVGRTVLNCFSYTGLFSLRAARLGAKSVIDVESSVAFNAVNAKQWERNGLDVPHEIVSENVFDYLRARDRFADKFDMIVLDPPAFTKNRASREGAVRGYNEINRTALHCLRPNGVLVTCSCSHHLSTAEFREIVESAAADAGRSLRLIAQRGQPPDHPVLLSAPESEYLKCLILAVD